MNPYSNYFLGALALLLGGILFIGGRPAHAQVQVEGKLTDDRAAKPGTVYEGVINIKNDTDRPQQARIYQTDYLFFADGTNEYGAPGSTPRSNASWIQLSPSDLTIQPGKTVPVKYVVHVPETGAKGNPLAGSYWSMIMVEGVSEVEMAPREKDGKPVITTHATIRHGYQVATHVGDPVRRLIEFDGVSLRQGEQAPASLQADVAATGNAMLRPEAWLELFGSDGAAVGRIEGQRYRIYPGTSVRYRFDLSHLPSGTYEALVLVDAGEDDILGAQYTLNL